MKALLKIFAVLLLLGVLYLETGCTSTQQGALIGSAVGAGSGAIIGHQYGHSGRGALIGAGVGALTGALVGDFLEHYEVEVRKKDPYQAPPSYDDYDTGNW